MHNPRDSYNVDSCSNVSPSFRSTYIYSYKNFNLQLFENFLLLVARRKFQSGQRQFSSNLTCSSLSKIHDWMESENDHCCSINTKQNGRVIPADLEK